MASFFQPPGSGDPVIFSCNPSNSSQTFRLVYCNRLISAQNRLQTPLQYFTFLVAILCLSIPILHATISWGYRLFGRWWEVKQGLGTRHRRSRRKHSRPSHIELHTLSSVKSFRFLSKHYTEERHNNNLNPSNQAWILPLPSFHQEESTYPSLLTSRSHAQLLLGLVDEEEITSTTVSIWVNFLANLVLKDRLVSGIVIRTRTGDLEEDDCVVLVDLLWQLNARSVPVLLNFSHDNGVFRHVDFCLLSGIIVDNACIMPNGHRRNFFRSQNLRDIMGMSSGERIHRPGFFVGFHDTWEKQPSAAVVSRAARVASHFEAVLEHGPHQDDGVGAKEVSGGLSMSLSGIEYLRKMEISQLQQTWVQQKRDVRLGLNEHDDASRLDLFDLRSIIHGADLLLEPVASAIPEDPDESSIEQTVTAAAPNYGRLAPPRRDCWTFSPDGEELSPLGCIPLTLSVTQKQYKAVLATQVHLRDLKMLQCFGHNDVDKLLAELQRLRPSTQHTSLLLGLIEGLSQQTVHVYRGLGTGFSLPDNTTECWGVSDYRVTDGVVDIFISRSCPSDVTTVLHTWLAHHDVSRAERYAEELRLERALLDHGRNALLLPLSIRSAITNSTPTETLFLMQQLQVSKLEHSLRTPIEEFCKTTLLRDTDLAAWNDATSRGFLSGSVTMQDLLARRLAEHATLDGSHRHILPSLDNLLELYTQIETVINDSLFSGDRATLNKLTNILLRAHASDPESTVPSSQPKMSTIDINIDLVTLMFFCALRKAALEDVYMEATDHCPIFSQPDQAAVFSELWVLGSQCELYFCMKPRALGKIIYDRYRAFLTEHPPPIPVERLGGVGQNHGGLMSVFAKVEPVRGCSGSGESIDATITDNVGFRVGRLIRDLRGRIVGFGALSIFCLPAIVDLLLLTFLGRGLFMTAYIGDDNLVAACYGLLLSLLISAGVTGWVGSVGNYYLCSYAYHNMIFFHVQRLSGGFMLSLTVGFVGAIVFGFKVSLSSACTFFAYIILLSTYLNVLGIIATMHQKGSPITSGRTVLWRTIPVLLTSPILSSFLNGHDLKIYLVVGYGFLLLVLFQYRKLCHEWMNWLDKIPTFTEKDVVEWHTSRLTNMGVGGGSSTQVSISSEVTRETRTSGEVVSKNGALHAFRQHVADYRQSLLHRPAALGSGDLDNDLVPSVAKGLPYIEWLLYTDTGDTTSQQTEVFSVPWFAQVVEAMKKRRQMTQGLKEHGAFMLIRYAKLDIGQNIGLFLVFLMDRWVSIVMSASSAPISVFSDFTSRYAVCFAILYFCCSVMALDVTLEGYWKVSFELSDERVSTCEEARAVTLEWERDRRRKYCTALLQLVRRALFVFGCTTVLVWLLVEKSEVLQLYYLYTLGYSAVVLFQFNRCFTTDVQYHVVSLLVSACLGFATGCAMHAIYKETPPIYLDVLALDVAAIISALLTSIWVWKDFAVATQITSSEGEGGAVDNQPGDNSGFATTPEQTNTEIMRHLCLGIDIDKEWENLPSDIRRAVISRIVGQPVQVSREFWRWMGSRKLDMKASDAHLAHCLEVYQRAQKELEAGIPPGFLKEVSPNSTNVGFSERTKSEYSLPKKSGLFRTMWVTASAIPLGITKWIAIISAGDANIERELMYSLRHWKPVRGVLLCVLLSIWNVCRYVRCLWLYGMLIYHHKSLVDISRLANKGASRVLCQDRVVVELRRKTSTGFLSRGEAGGMMLDIFDGNMPQCPVDGKPVVTAVYDGQFRLVGLDGGRQNATVYSYAEGNNTRVPTCKFLTAGDVRQCYVYDDKGRAMYGTVAFRTTAYSFRYFYHRDSFDVLRGEFRLVEPDSFNSLTVYWGVPLQQERGGVGNWIPSDQVSKVERRIGAKTYITTYDYQHRRDPGSSTIMKDGTTETKMTGRPPRLFDHEELLQRRPSDVAFEDDDFLFFHGRSDIRRAIALSGKSRSWASVFRPSVWQYRRKKVIYRPVPTWWLRTELWSSWRKSGQFDAITACWMDEFILRQEPTLRKYWAWRGAGHLSQAKKTLDSHINEIVPIIEIAQEVSEICLLPIKPADLYAMGLGKDANQVTTRPQDCFRDTDERISVIFNDVGCWPDAPGGVSNCRRDLVNGHSTIRNHVLAECGNEYGIPRFQVERNVQSLKLVPLWGLDERTPNHGLIDNLLESQVDEKIANTDTKRDIVGKFVPLLRLFVKGARSKHVSKRDMVRYSNVMLEMFKYFEHKDYNKTWKSKEVASAWVDAWLTRYDNPDITDPDEYFEIEKPSVSDFRSALSIYTSYFFIFSVQTPEDCPQVFQSTHHGISSLFGMLLKYRRGTTFGIWDHAILWRECCLNISPAQTTLPLPVQSMLLAGMGLAMRLAYFHADVVLPCTSVFNPVWEGDLATDSGRLGHVKKFNRKIDPIVNGVSNMDAFQPVDEIRTSTPTVVMLSNVQFIKDIKTAILAADIIVNQYGFKDYQLLVYGAQDREPEYAIDMAKMIESLGLRDNVLLKGFGKPQEILKDAWLFMNSSLSEGLPLAVAEAALAAVPVVATAVGATSLILRDPDDESVSYGEVVPPNDAVALARAQVSMLAMVGTWGRFVGGAGGGGGIGSGAVLPDGPLTGEVVEKLSKRMHEVKIKEARMALGMLGRQVVLRGFHGERYLREHEQMYWIQWHLAGMRRDPGPELRGNAEFLQSCVRWIEGVERDNQRREDTEGKGKKLRKKVRVSTPNHRAV